LNDIRYSIITAEMSLTGKKWFLSVIRYQKYASPYHRSPAPAGSSDCSDFRLVSAEELAAVARLNCHLLTARS